MSLWTIILYSCSNVPFPFWVNLLNPQPLEGETLPMCILDPRGIAPWAGDGYTPKENQLVIKAEPNIVTFWEFGIEILRDGICLLQCKKMLTQRKQPTMLAKLTGGRPRDPCCWGPRNSPASSHTWGLVNCLSLESRETTWYFYSLSWWIGFLFPPSKQIFAKAHGHPMCYDKTGLCDSVFISKCLIKEKLLHIFWWKMSVLETMREFREGRLCLMETQGVWLCFYIFEVLPSGSNANFNIVALG